MLTAVTEQLDQGMTNVEKPNQSLELLLSKFQTRSTVRHKLMNNTSKLLLILQPIATSTKTTRAVLTAPLHSQLSFSESHAAAQSAEPLGKS